MKKIVRLTEGSFRNIIKETVRKAINELDWRTYASASKKSINRAVTRGGTMNDYKRGLDFSAASEDAFDRDYGYVNKDDGEYRSHDFRPEDDEYSTVGGTEPSDGEKINLGTYKPFKKVNHHYTSKNNLWNPSFDSYSDLEPGNKPGTVKSTEIEPSQFYDKASQGLKNDIKRGNKAVDDFALGKTTYIPRSKGGRGWANYDESKVKSFIKQVIKEALNDEAQDNYALYAIVRYVDPGADDYDKICKLYERNPQKAINYLAQWDSDECELEDKKPRLTNYDDKYTSDDNYYTLLYNPTIGGCFLLYRMATQNEIDWYKENH